MNKKWKKKKLGGEENPALHGGAQIMGRGAGELEPGAGRAASPTQRRAASESAGAQQGHGGHSQESAEDRAERTKKKKPLAVAPHTTTDLSDPGKY